MPLPTTTHRRKFHAGVSFHSPPFSLLRRLVLDDHRYWHCAIELRFSDQTPLPRALLCPRKVAGSSHGARSERATKVDGKPDRAYPPISPAPPFLSLGHRQADPAHLCNPMPRTGPTADQWAPFRWGPTYHPPFV
jgi:hypothetical protein